MATPAARDAAGALLFIAAGTAILVMGAGLPAGSLRLPGPGAFPAAIGIGLIALSAIALLRALRRPPAAPDHGEAPPEPGGRVRVALVGALLAAFTLALPYLGFLAASTLLLIALYAIGAGRLGLGPVLAGLATAAATHLLFVVALGLRLPQGQLWGS